MFIKTSKGNRAKQHDLIFLCLFMWTVIDSKQHWTFTSCSLQLEQTILRNDSVPPAAAALCGTSFLISPGLSFSLSNAASLPQVFVASAFAASLVAAVP